jgi:outer membrane protein assembly factor BamE (lipoprotein component of BamABCDE complex)
MLYGNYPLGSYPNSRIRIGMTADEVVATLGTPHQRRKRDEGVTWYYWIDSFGDSWFGVDFGPDGRVVYTYGN